MDISVEVDALTPCLRRVSDGKVVDTEVSQIHPQKGQFIEWEFDWSIPEKEGFSVYALKVKGEKSIQGLLATKVENGYVDVALVEASPKNSPHNPNYCGVKEYEGVGAHLFATACKQSFDSGNDGYVAFTAKTNLVPYYSEALGATVISGQRMMIEESAAALLVEKYFGRKESWKNSI